VPCTKKKKKKKARQIHDWDMSHIYHAIRTIVPVAPTKRYVPARVSPPTKPQIATAKAGNREKPAQTGDNDTQD
jgi:hypothetical protein